MAAIDFPASPTTGQTFTAPNGVIYQYDGVKWVVGFSPTGLVAFKTAAPTGCTPAPGQWVTYRVLWSTTPTFNNGGGLWDGSFYTVKTAGLYHIYYSLGMVWPAAAMYASQGEAYIYVNGAEVGRTSICHAVAQGPLYVTYPTFWSGYLNVNDTIAVWGFNSNGGSGYGAIITDGKWTNLAITRIGS